MNTQRSTETTPLVYLRPHELELLRLIVQVGPTSAESAREALRRPKGERAAIGAALRRLHGLGLVDTDAYGNATPNDAGRARLATKRKPSRRRF